MANRDWSAVRVLARVSLSLWPLTVGFVQPFNSYLLILLGDLLGGFFFWPLFLNFSLVFTGALTGLGLMSLRPKAKKVDWMEGFHELGRRIEASKWDIFSLCGGIVLPVSVGSNAFTSKWIGFGPTYLGVSCGLVLSSLIIDWKGLFWAQKRPVTWLDILGAFLVLGGTAMFVAGTIEGDMVAGVSVNHGKRVGLLILAVVSGILLVIQGALNKRLTQALGDPWRSASWAAFCAVVGLFPLAMSEGPRAPEAISRTPPSEAFRYLSGLIGLAILLTSMSAPRYLGFSLYAKARVSGEVVGAVLIGVTHGLYSLAKEQRERVTTLAIVGLMVTFVGFFVSLKWNDKPPSEVVTQEVPPAGPAGVGGVMGEGGVRSRSQRNLAVGSESGDAGPVESTGTAEGGPSSAAAMPPHTSTHTDSAHVSEAQREYEADHTKEDSVRGGGGIDGSVDRLKAEKEEEGSGVLAVQSSDSKQQLSQEYLECLSGRRRTPKGGILVQGGTSTREETSSLPASPSKRSASAPIEAYSPQQEEKAPSSPSRPSERQLDVSSSRRFLQSLHQSEISDC
uniref:Uncharacterized protein n=1 Tax=Chromera velia CCMP2878 TaxID=1169474 RepID=A0A0G4FKT3_9ALVE|eukprot:Cvel_3452.t1-p1 / transcript=Cvel_3452.t1 / gene=Cvel_3452 / organism=Chromera_velia_CCMP2878 / gene_product=hypothetical protein / transcript_product=hypothetical protein / location=Cvel_scaffold139:38842-40530(+) / protein_length=563 / sequence_SO=supercontig / SO=protein_coding / is_pseudo=false